MVTRYLLFKEGVRVNIDESYLTDEVNVNNLTTPSATVISEPKDCEELVCIQYDNCIIDFVPQEVLEPIN